jgi:hypothetical protein
MRLILVLLVLLFGCDNVSWNESDSNFKQQDRLLRRLESLAYCSREGCEKTRERIQAELRGLQKGGDNY